MGGGLPAADGVGVGVATGVAGVAVVEDVRDSGDVVSVGIGDTARTETGGVEGT